MSPPPIPLRIPALIWRAPAVLWTPLALVVAIGWPALLFIDAAGLRRAALILGAAAFSAALLTLGASWALGRAPKARRIVVLHVVIAGALAALAAPFAFTELLAAAGHGDDGLDFAASLAMAPLALLLGLPIALVSGVAFAWIALATPRPPAARISAHDIQPFQ